MRCPDASAAEREEVVGDEEARAVVAAAPSPAFDWSEGTADLKVCTAFDYMRVKVGDIPKLEAFTPAFIELLRDRGRDDDGEDDEADDKPPASKKAKKNQSKKQKSAPS